MTTTQRINSILTAHGLAPIAAPKAPRPRKVRYTAKIIDGRINPLSDQSVPCYTLADARDSVRKLLDSAGADWSGEILDAAGELVEGYEIRDGKVTRTM